MTVVVKVGGARGNEVEAALDEVRDRPDLVLVHGGSEEVDRVSTALGRPTRYYTSPSGVVSRHTDPAHLEAVVMALSGNVQTELVRSLEARGVHAVGLSGVDGGLVQARRKEGQRAVENGRVLRLTDDRSGSVEEVRPELLRLLLAHGYVPVVAPPALTPSGEVVNVDADRVASATAVALGAEALVLLTNVPGLLRDLADPASRVARVDRATEPEALALARGRMHKKVRAAIEAVHGGVHRAIIASSAGAGPIRRALEGDGTVFQ